MQYYKNFNLQFYNSFRLNSVAKKNWFPESTEQLQNLLKELKGKEFFVLAGGTNVILKPIISRVICLKSMPKYLRLGIKTGVIVSANYLTASLVLNGIESYIVGLEGLYGLPGTIGGAIIGNAGSGNYAISDYLLSVTTIDYNGILHTYSKESLQFGRRYSILQEKKEIIIEALFGFEDGIPNKEEIAKAVGHRKSLPKYPSAGGIFKNWHALKPYSDKLIGLRIGDAEVSDKINIIINKRNATFYDIMELIKKIKNIVKKPLKLEVKIIG